MRARFAALRAAVLTIALSTLLSAAPLRAADRAVILILDASASMRVVRPNGKTGMDEAKERLLKAVDSASPTDTELGLLVFGSQAGGCDDIEMAVPPGIGTAERIRAAVRSVVPRGLTPLTAAIEQAKNYFSHRPDGENEVQLFTDGYETCGQDPVAAVSVARAAGQIKKVDVVGINVAPGEQAQLDQIAMAGGGTFLNIPAVFPMGISPASFAPPGLLQHLRPPPPAKPNEPERGDEYKPPAIDASVFDKEVDFGTREARRDSPPPPPRPTPPPPRNDRRPDSSDKPDLKKRATTPVPKPNLPVVTAPPMLLP